MYSNTVTVFARPVYNERIVPYTETHIRTIAKTLSWRVLATLLTLCVIWFFTGEFVVSLVSTVTAAVLSTIAYYIHERAWNRFSWGKTRER